MTSNSEDFTVMSVDNFVFVISLFIQLLSKPVDGGI